MSWIDEAKRRRAKLEAAKKVQTEKWAAEKAQKEADLEAKEQRYRGKEVDRFMRIVKTRLPAGVEIVDAFWHVFGPEEHPIKYDNNHEGGPVVRIDLGDSVRLDLRRVKYSSYSYCDSGGPSSSSHSDYFEIYPAGCYSHYRLVQSQGMRGPDDMSQLLYDSLIAFQEDQKR